MFDRAKRIRQVALAGSLVVSLMGAGVANGASISPRAQKAHVASQKPISLPTDQIIIKFKSAGENAPNRATAGRIAAVQEALGKDVTFFREMSGDASVFKLPSRMDEADVQALADKLMRRAAALEIEYAEPDSILQADGGPLEAESPSLIPNDPGYPSEWNLQAVSATNYGINMPPAWDITSGSADVRIAILSSGFTGGHSDFIGRVVGGYDFISNPASANDGDGRDGDPADPGDWESAELCGAGTPSQNSLWAGTKMAGVIGARGNNTYDMTGINWVSPLVPVRVIGRCGVLFSDVVDGMRWAAGLSVPGVPANPNPARVLVIGFGSFGAACNTTSQSAINDVNAANSMIIASATSGMSDVSGLWPVNCAGVIAVAATNRLGDLAFYSNHGSRVAISAPGGDLKYGTAEGILTAINLGATSPTAPSYDFVQGSFMAAAHVAGVVSLMLSVNPSLTRAQILDIIRMTATGFPANSSCTPSVCGAGIINAGNAVSMARAGMFRKTFLPMLNGPGTLQTRGIYGTVKLNGAPVAGVSVDLLRRNNANDAGALVATAVTDVAGMYKFPSAPTLNPGQSYYVRSVDISNPARLYYWATRDIPYYESGRNRYFGEFDIATFPLGSPANGATVTLPQTFTWTRRPATPSDSYVLRVGNTGFTPRLESPKLGYVNNLTLLPGVLSSKGFIAGTQYYWYIFVYGPDFGSGRYQEVRAITFTNP